MISHILLRCVSICGHMTKLPCSCFCHVNSGITPDDGHRLMCFCAVNHYYRKSDGKRADEKQERTKEGTVARSTCVATATDQTEVILCSSAPGMEMSVSQIAPSSTPLTSNYTICQVFTSQSRLGERRGGGGGGGLYRILLLRPARTVGEMNVVPRWSPPHKHTNKRFCGADKQMGGF